MTLANILWAVVVIIVVIWLFGLLFDLAAGSPLIHLLLVIALVVIIINVLMGRSAA
jgi:hypothetical protein